MPVDGAHSRTSPTLADPSLLERVAGRNADGFEISFARENQDVVTRETFVVRRDGPDGSLLETPDHELDEWDSDSQE